MQDFEVEGIITLSVGGTIQAGSLVEAEEMAIELIRGYTPCGPLKVNAQTDYELTDLIRA